MVFEYLALEFSNQYKESSGKGKEPKDHNVPGESVGREQEYHPESWKQGVSLSRKKTREDYCFKGCKNLIKHYELLP